MLQRADRRRKNQRAKVWEFETHPPVVVVTTFSHDTLRKRRLRQRVRDGKAVLIIEVAYHDLVEAMIVSKRLSESESLDRRAVEADASMVLAQWIAEVFERVGRR